MLVGSFVAVRAVHAASAAAYLSSALALRSSNAAILSASGASRASIFARYVSIDFACLIALTASTASSEPWRAMASFWASRTRIALILAFIKPCAFVASSMWSIAHFLMSVSVIRKCVFA